MEVDEAAAATSSYKGETYYFCAPGCKKEFDANPDEHVAPAGFGLSTEGLARGSVLLQLGHSSQGRGPASEGVDASAVRRGHRWR